ncbi:MAG: hypothetical protein ACM3VZ_13040 [Acidobacteriota bacterium]
MNKQKQGAKVWALACIAAAALMGCGGGGSGGGESPGAESGTSGGNTGGNTGGNGPAQPASQPLGTYWSWRTVPRLVLGAGGYPYYIQAFEYYFVTFYNNGLAYVGPVETDPAATRCDEVRTNDSGTKLCVPYTVANGQLTLDGDSRVLTSKPNGVWTYGDTSFTPMPDTRNDKLDGAYSSIDCYWATCTRAWIKFTPDGRYSLDTLNTSVFTVPDFMSTSMTNGASKSGTYQIGSNVMVLTPDGGTPVKVFYFRDHTASADTVLLDDTRYEIDQP